MGMRMTTQTLVTILTKVQGSVAHEKTLKVGYMVGNLAIIAMRRTMMESRKTKNLKESIRKRNMKVGKVRGLQMKGASNTAVRARRTRRLVNAIMYVRPQTDRHHHRRTVPKALRAAPRP